MFRTNNTIAKKAIIGAAIGAVLMTAACSSSSEQTDDTDAQETTAPAPAPEASTPAPTEPVETAPSAPIVEISDAWARSMPNGMGAVYAKITSNVDDAILTASVTPATIAGMVEVHEVVTGDDGMMKMQQVERVELPAGTTVELKPGSYHVMLMGMPEMLPVGSTFQVTLTFENADPITFTVTVSENTGGMGSGMDMGSDAESGMDMGSDNGSGMDMGSGMGTSDGE